MTREYLGILSSIELLQFWPEVPQILIRPAAEPESELFVTPRVGVLHAPDGFHTLERLTITRTVAP